MHDCTRKRGTDSQRKGKLSRVYYIAIHPLFWAQLTDESAWLIMSLGSSSLHPFVQEALQPNLPYLTLVHLGDRQLVDLTKRRERAYVMQQALQGLKLPRLDA